MYKTRLRLDEARKCCFTWKAGNPPLDIFSSVFSLSKYFLQGTPGRGQEKLDSVESLKSNKTSSAWGGTRCGAGVCERGTGPAPVPLCPWMFERPQLRSGPRAVRPQRSAWSSRSEPGSAALASEPAKAWLSEAGCAFQPPAPPAIPWV